jgi:hypothetical protein
MMKAEFGLSAQSAGKSMKRTLKKMMKVAKTVTDTHPLGCTDTASRIHQHGNTFYD